MSTGMTLKQMARVRFWNALDRYKESLRTNTNLVATSLVVHAALGADGVPKSYKRHITRAISTRGME